MTTSSSTTQSQTDLRPARLPALRRVDPGHLPPFRLTARDVSLVRAVYEYRALTTVQVERLFFSPPAGRPTGDSPAAAVKINPRCQHRLKMLYHHGYLYRDEQPTKLSEGRRPLVYFLDAGGAARLGEEMGVAIDWDPAGNNVSWPFLDHLLLTNDFRIAVTVAARAHHVTLKTWIDDKVLKSQHQKDYVIITGTGGGKHRIAVVPDGYFVLDTDKRVFHHFLEIDRGTVTGSYRKDGRRDWSHKVRGFNEYVASGKYEGRYNTTKVRILTVTTGQKRLEHLKQITEAVGGGSRFWFTTFDAVTPHTILTEPIWSVAGSAERRPLLI